MRKLLSTQMLPFFLAASFLLSVTFIGCSEAEKKEEPKTEENKMDEGNTMPVKPAPKDGTLSKDSAATVPADSLKTQEVKP